MNAHTLVNSLLEADPDNPSKEHLIRMGRASECQELCNCGAYCTLRHYALNGKLMPPYHICQTCDLESAKVTEADDPQISRVRKRLLGLHAQPIPAEDDPEAYVKGEVARRAEPIKKLEVQGRRWYRRGAGGVYCKAYIYINDKLEHVTSEQGGYGEHYLTLAADWLERNGYTQRRHRSEPLWQTAQQMGFEFIRNVTDVRRERDL